MSHYNIVIKTPLGLMRVRASDLFVEEICFTHRQQKVASNDLCRQAARELEEYFAGQRQTFSFPILLSGTAWQNLVWQKLLSVPYGAIISYQDLAELCRQPQAARAVGQAVNKNPLAIVVPCHRVVGSRGNLVGYAGGLTKKRALLAGENSH